jgi:ABC-type transporter MlaC component/cell division protein FtsN
VGFVTLPPRPSIWSALAATALGLSLLSAASSVWAGAPTDALRDFFGGVNIVLTDPATEQQPFERLRLIRSRVNDAFDFREAAKLALGREWAARTRIEQNEFVAMFADLLERSFVWRVAGKASLGGGVKVRYLDERVTGDVATVDTELAGRDGNEIRLQYRLVHRSARWVVCDVVMDGVSTMQNYHAQFQRIVRESSYTQLASQLRTKLGLSAVGAQVTPIPIAAAAPPLPNVMPFGSPQTTGPMDLERQAIARDVAAVVTPGLVVSDVAPSVPPRAAGAAPTPAESPRTTVAQPSAAPAPSSQRAEAAPPPVGPMPIATGSSSVQMQSPTTTPEPTATPAPAPEPVTPAAVAPTSQALATPPTPATPSVVATPPALAPVKQPAPRVNGATPIHSGSGSAFWVQVGAYRDTVAAGRVAKAVNGEILIVAESSNGATRVADSPLLRVRVGPFVERTQAVSRARDLQALGYKPFIAAGE